MNICLAKNSYVNLICQYALILRKVNLLLGFTAAITEISVPIPWG